MSTKRSQTRHAMRARRDVRPSAEPASLMMRAEQRTMSLVTWIAGTIAGAIGWAGLECGVAPWLGARRAAIVRIVAFVRGS